MNQFKVLEDRIKQIMWKQQTYINQIAYLIQYSCKEGNDKFKAPSSMGTYSIYIKEKNKKNSKARNIIYLSCLCTQRIVVRKSEEFRFLFSEAIEL